MTGAETCSGVEAGARVQTEVEAGSIVDLGEEIVLVGSHCMTNNSSKVSSYNRCQECDIRYGGVLFY